MPAYLVLLQMEVTAFHVRLSAYSSLWPYSSPHGGRLLAAILLFAARTFLPHQANRMDLLDICGNQYHIQYDGDCLANLWQILTYSFIKPLNIRPDLG